MFNCPLDLRRGSTTHVRGSISWSGWSARPGGMLPAIRFNKMRLLLDEIDRASPAAAAADFAIPRSLFQFHVFC